MDDIKLSDSELYDVVKAAIHQVDTYGAPVWTTKALIALWQNNRDRLRFMVWSDAEHEPPIDPVVFASHTPEPPEPVKVSSGEVFRLRMPLNSNRWRTPAILLSVIAYELSREDLPSAVIVMPHHRDHLDYGVDVEAFYNVAAIESRGVFYSPYLSELVKP